MSKVNFINESGLIPKSAIDAIKINEDRKNIITQLEELYVESLNIAASRVKKRIEDGLYGRNHINYIDAKREVLSDPLTLNIHQQIVKMKQVSTEIPALILTEAEFTNIVLK